MKPPPKGWPQISQVIFYDDPKAAIDWLCRVFGFEVKMLVEGDDGGVAHSELTYGHDGLIMVGGVADRHNRPSPLPAVSPRGIDGRNTMAVCMFVDDADAHCADAHCAHAKAAGATIVDEPETHDYGEDHWADRTYRAVDCEGHHWWFMQRVRG